MAVISGTRSHKRQGTSVQEPFTGPQRPVPLAGPSPATLSEVLCVRPPGSQGRIPDLEIDMWKNNLPRFERYFLQ